MALSIMFSCDLQIIPNETIGEANFTVGSPNQALYQGCPVQFLNGSSQTSVFQWDFGDGSTSAEKDPIHLYSTPGKYDVKLVVSDGVVSDDTTIKITVVQQSRFDRKFGDYSLANGGESVILDSDGNFVMVGHATDVNNGWIRRIYLAKFDSDGDVVHSKLVDSSGSPLGYSIIQTHDGRYVIVGFVAAPNGSGYANLYILITDSEFNVLEENKNIGGPFHDYGHSVVELPNGDLFIAGSKGIDEFSKKTWLVHTNSSGEFIEQHLYKKNSISGLNDITLSPNGNIIIAATVDNFTNGSSDDIYLMEVRLNGQVQWEKVYDDFKYSDVANGLIRTSDGSYVIVGNTLTSAGGGPDAFLIKAEAQGGFINSEQYGGDGANYFYSVAELGNGDLVMVGSTYGTGNGQVLLVKTDTDGQSPKTKTYGDAKNDNARDVVIASDCGLALFGTFDASSSSCCSRFYFFKTDSDGN